MAYVNNDPGSLTMLTHNRLINLIVLCMMVLRTVDSALLLCHSLGGWEAMPPWFV